MKRRSFFAGAGLAGTLPWLAAPARAAGPSVVTAWSRTTINAFASTFTGPTVAARGLSMVFEAIYNAWACYGDAARFTLPGMGVRPANQWRDDYKSIAISHAAHRVLLNLYPSEAATFDSALAAVLAGLPVAGPEGMAAAQTGQLAASLLVQSRIHDGANQADGYRDTTGYMPVNTPDQIVDPARWQPLRLTSSTGVTTVQEFLTPHWGLVRPFALTSGSQYRPSLSPRLPTAAEIQEILYLSANLNDAQKCQVDFFANNPGSVTPPGQWMQIAELVSTHDGNSLDRDVMLFSLVAQAMLDASIAAWESKRYHDSVRCITTIRQLYQGQMIEGWLGVGKGRGMLPGELWHPYQRTSNSSPNFAEFVSGHSTFSGAAAGVIAGFRGDRLPVSFTVAANGIRFDPSVPAAPVTFKYKGVSEIAAAAGYSRRLGGIHFVRGDMAGRKLGADVAKAVLKRAASLLKSKGGDD